MEVHIALVGGQTMPVCIGIKEICADRVVLIHSSDSKKDAERISNKFPSVTELKQFDPVDYFNVYVEADKLVSSFFNDHVTINVSSGTKPWAIAFSLLSTKYHNVTIIYVDQNCVFYDYTHHKQWNSSVLLDTSTILSFNRQKADSYVKLDDYTEEDLSVMKKIKQIRDFNINEFNRLTIPDKSRKNQFKLKLVSSYVLENGSFVSWDKNNNTVSIQIKCGSAMKKIELISPHLFSMLFNSGWFEYEVAVLLSKWKFAREIWLNVVFPYNNKDPKNEIDIIINTGSKLLFVECKTQIFDNTDIDKFRTAVKNYGGMGCKALFLTKEVMRPEAKEKCNDSGILSFSLASSSSILPKDKSLYMLLESELFNINSK